MAPNSRSTGEAFLGSFFESVGRDLGAQFQFVLREPEDAAEGLTDWLEELPLALQAESAGGPAGAVVLLSLQGANQLATGDVDAGATLDAQMRETLAELGRKAMAAGLRALGANMDDIRLEDITADAAPALLATLGGGGAGFPTRFESEGGPSGELVLLLDAALLAAPTLPSPTLTPDEMQDILSGLTDVPVAPAAQSGQHEENVPGRENIGMVLDIRLVATARLGRIEMPIGNILGLGPGSIIEVGHLVDEPVDLLINDKLIARGDVVVVDEKFGLRITEIISPRERIESLR